MTKAIVNGAPMTRFLGVRDLSTRTVSPDAEVLPTHLPKVYIYAQTGPTTPQLVVGAGRTKMYGSYSFDLRKKWANHATVLSNVLNEAANSQMIQRVIPADAAPEANLRLWLDVLETTLPIYKRNSDGSIATDSTGAYIETSDTAVGFKAKWVVTYIGKDNDGNSTFGLGTQVAGDQTDATGTVQSTRYPIMDLAVSHIGDQGNNIALRLWAATSVSSSPVSERVLSKELVYPFRVACVERATSDSTPSAVDTLDGEQYVDLCWKQGVIDRTTDQELYIGENFLSKWQDLEPTDGTPPVYGPFGNIKVYDSNINELITKFYAAEKPYIDTFSDFTGAADEEYLFNMVSGVSSQNVAYRTFQLVTTGDNAFKPTEGTNIWATGGSDGTMNEELFAALVSEAVADYASETSELQDMARYPESVIYDSGFPLATKQALCQFIALRYDTAVVLSVGIAGEAALSVSAESSRALVLKTYLANYPESDYWGTPTLRGAIVGRSGKLLNSQYKKRLPLTIEFAQKNAKYMGAGNGKWNGTYNFDVQPNNQITMFGEVNAPYASSKVRNKDWDNGMIWVEYTARRTLYFPAIRSVYSDDTSVLTSWFTMMACVELEKIGEKARRQFSGTSTRTNDQLADDIVTFVTEQCAGKFDDRVTIKPVVTFTASDETRGYSWTLTIQVYADNMKTVQTLSIEAYRSEDLETAS